MTPPPTPAPGSTGDKLVFSVKPRLLRLLGDQLIRVANLTLFQLVKNAYDADPTRCSVSWENPDRPAAARIDIVDNGNGMGEAMLRNAPMVISTDFIAHERPENASSKLFHTFHPPFHLGEKELGRVSAHKLGRFIPTASLRNSHSSHASRVDFVSLR